MHPICYLSGTSGLAEKTPTTIAFSPICFLKGVVGSSPRLEGFLFSKTLGEPFRDEKTALSINPKYMEETELTRLFIIKNKLGVWGESSGRVGWERNSAEQDGRDRTRKDLVVGTKAF